MCKAYSVVLYFLIEQLSAEHIGVFSSFLEGLLIKTATVSQWFVPIICVDSGYAPLTHLNPDGPPVCVTPEYAPPICMEPSYALPVP